MNLKQLAEQLGLSQTTVSRALNGYPEVSDATRRRVQEAAQRFNYRPNARARSLATGNSMIVGHVIPVSDRHEMVNPVFMDFIAGAGECYTRAGYDILLSVVTDDDEARTYRRLAKDGIVDGVIVHGPRHEDPRVPLLQSLGLPFVVHGRTLATDPAFSWLDIDNTRSFRRATGLLTDLGHRRIALLNGLEWMDFAQRRREGYLQGLADAGLTMRPELMHSDEMTEDFGHDVAARLLDGSEPPTAFLVSSCITALGVRRAVETRGMSVGRDVSIVTHDDDLSYLGNRGDVPSFTATRSSVRQAGRRCAEILLGLIASRQEDQPTPPVQELWESQLLVGRSTGPARDRAEGTT
ncbi:LacI family transcriptional regulator [Brevirhabdus pacifica]|uniref:LacI family transcriptional regulator n=1 Tax=Brevirhabdus pacifica TaxID=1267768 RepID=A0A1U7DEV0_9RHOB|nr:substrate-binding domain-containing protein [Brevirhabdus pacifica]APX88408.1 LacI family transcriptional regulator [Brevirhabdus pacifica]OWU79719.1 LacI family transcriptional regulator [Loktanella sp. 22II-4b]PJJ87133.1 LacI family transcriptional regulator [Brevirhabdus pacifica]